MTSSWFKLLKWGFHQQLWGFSQKWMLTYDVYISIVRNSQWLCEQPNKWPSKALQWTYHGSSHGKFGGFPLSIFQHISSFISFWAFCSCDYPEVQPEIVTSLVSHFSGVILCSTTVLSWVKTRWHQPILWPQMIRKEVIYMVESLCYYWLLVIIRQLPTN